MRLARRLVALLGPLAAGWLACWLIPGLLLGRPAALLDGSAPEGWKMAYVAFLYLVILASTFRAWRRCGPGCGAPALGSPRLSGLFGGLGLGLLGVGTHRLVLAWGGWWSPPALSWETGLQAVGVALVLAFGEEVLFRGYLFGVLREELARPRAYLVANALFAVVHLLRPGDPLFKMAYGLGLFLAGAVLCRLAENSGSLWAGIGLHSAWILMGVLDPPARIHPGWISGLGGDPAAGGLGWALLVSLWVGLGILGRSKSPPATSRPGS